MNELGIQPDRTTTTTGGLSFFGGPMNSYVIHAIASTVDAVRSSGEYGFIHANGGYATKHACAVYSNRPPEGHFQRRNVQKEINTHPQREVAINPEGKSTIESYTVLYDRQGANKALVTSLMEDGKRALASTSDAETMESMIGEEYVGKTLEFTGSGSFEIL
jgi:acetyl-CoA C-acetyltransferase